MVGGDAPHGALRPEGDPSMDLVSVNTRRKKLLKTCTDHSCTTRWEVTGDTRNLNEVAARGALGCPARASFALLCGH